MKILHEKPPEWIMSGCLSQFRVNVDSTFWTYGDIIYNPGGKDLRDDIIAHEEQHMRQQEAYEGGKDAWWRDYLAKPRFRLEQEAEAYGVQYKFICRTVKDRNKRAKWLHHYASQLSGPLYQVAVSPIQARQLIEVLAGMRKLPVAAPAV